MGELSERLKESIHLTGCSEIGGSSVPERIAEENVHRHNALSLTNNQPESSVSSPSALPNWLYQMYGAGVAALFSVIALELTLYENHLFRTIAGHFPRPVLFLVPSFYRVCFFRVIVFFSCLLMVIWLRKRFSGQPPLWWILVVGALFPAAACFYFFLWHALHATNAFVLPLLHLYDCVQLLAPLSILCFALVLSRAGSVGRQNWQPRFWCFLGVVAVLVFPLITGEFTCKLLASLVVPEVQYTVRKLLAFRLELVLLLLHFFCAAVLFMSICPNLWSEMSRRQSIGIGLWFTFLSGAWGICNVFELVAWPRGYVDALFVFLLFMPLFSIGIRRMLLTNSPGTERMNGGNQIGIPE